MKNKYLETLQMNISNSYCEKRKLTCIFNKHNLFKAALFTRLFRHTIKPRNTGTSSEHGWNSGTLTEHRIFEENVCLKALAVEVHIATSIS